MHSAFATIFVLVVLAAAIPEFNGKRKGTAMPIINHSTLSNADNTVNFEALNSHVATVWAKTLDSVLYGERDTGATNPAAVKRSGAGEPPSGTGLGLTSHPSIDGYPFFWYTTITIGTPPKSFSVEIDTGSSDLFIPGPECVTCLGHTLWNPAVDSSTVSENGQRFYAKFADKSYASGYLYTDNVTIAGFTTDDQVIGAARIYSPKFRKARFAPDGMMGMAFKSLSVSGKNTVLESLVAQHKLPEPAFSTKLTRTGGELYVGGSNRDLYNGDFSFTRVTRQAQWQVVMDGVVGNGKMILSNVDAIIDTGTTLIAGDRARVATLHRELGGKLMKNPPGVTGDFYTYACNDLPIVSLIFGGKPFRIFDVAFNIGEVSEGSPDCVCAIFGLESATAYWIVGGAFLQGVYTMFDLGNSRVGFADLA